MLATGQGRTKALRITSTQIMLLRALVGIGGTWEPTKLTIQGTPELLHRQFAELEQFRLVTRLDTGTEIDPLLPGDRFLNDWRITIKGIAVSNIDIDPVPAHSMVAAPVDVVNLVTEDGVMISGQCIESGTLIRVNGKQGNFKFLDTHLTSKGRVVLNLIGPVGIHQAFHAAYLEDARLLPVPRQKRKYARKA